MVCGVCNVWGNVYEKRRSGMRRNKMEERRGEAIISEIKRN